MTDSQEPTGKTFAGSPRSNPFKRFVPDLLEHGGPVRGVPQTLDQRLFLQFQVFTGCQDVAPVVEAVRESALEAVVYVNLNDPRGIGVLLLTENPDVLASAGRELFLRHEFAGLKPLPDFTMLGRTYASGRG